MRCLTLADALKSHGARTCFVCRHLPEYLAGKLAEHGHELRLIASAASQGQVEELHGLAHASWLGVSQETDAADSLQALSGESWDWLVVDHYALDSLWESAMRQAASRIMAIDDIADRQHDCEILLDQNYYDDMEARYRNKVPAHCWLLLGPRYALLREEFRQLRTRVQGRQGEVRRLLVFFGGVDAENHTGRAIAALSGLDLPGVQVVVVIGSQHPRRDLIEAECARSGYACHVQTDRMAELMAKADLALGAGGTAVWERCCLGLPTVAISTARNQERQLVDAAEAGLVCLPELGADLEQEIRTHVLALQGNGYYRRQLSRTGMQLVDGLGAQRVADGMGCDGIGLRLAGMDDAERLFAWRNHPSVRAVSFNKQEISRVDHQRWMAATLNNTRRMLLIGERLGEPFGVVRFDLNDEGSAEISIYLDAAKQSSGLGGCLMRAAERWLQMRHPEVASIMAQVRGGNERSHRLFAHAGYEAQSTTYLKRLY